MKQCRNKESNNTQIQLVTSGVSLSDIITVSIDNFVTPGHTYTFLDVYPLLSNQKYNLPLQVAYSESSKLSQEVLVFVC